MASQARQPQFSAADLAKTCMQAAGWCATFVVPHSADEKAIALVREVWRRTKVRAIRSLGERLGRALPGRLDQEAARQLSERWFSHRAEFIWGRLRELRGSGWRVRLDLEGGERLQEALRGGRGAVVWHTSLCDSFLLMKGLAQADLAVCHLSVFTHGAPGKSRFGVATAGRVHRIAEDRYLSERVIRREASHPSYFKRLLDALRANRVVTIRGDLGATGSTLTADCLGRTCRFLTGAPRVAYQAGAPLFTGYTKRVGPAHYRVVIQEAIGADRSDKRRFMQEAVSEFGRRLDAQLESDSADWEGWWWMHTLIADGPEAGESD